MNVIIKDGKSKDANTRKVKISEVRWSVKFNCFVMTIGRYDGFYDTCVEKNVQPEEIEFSDEGVFIYVSNQKDMETLANDLESKSRECRKSLFTMHT